MIIVIRCKKCGKLKRLGDWIIPRVDQYIEMCTQMGKGDLVFHDSLCDEHEGA